MEERIVVPTVQGLAHDGIALQRFHLHRTDERRRRSVRHRVQRPHGDPETEAVIPRITGDLVELLLATGQGTVK